MGRREAELAAAVKEIGRNVTGIQGDVSNLGDLDRLFAQIKQEKGKLDIVFANTGVAKFAALGAITEELYDWTFDINVKGLLFTVQKALPLLSDGASIILNSSVVASKEEHTYDHQMEVCLSRKPTIHPLLSLPLASDTPFILIVR